MKKLTREQKEVLTDLFTKIFREGREGGRYTGDRQEGYLNEVKEIIEPKGEEKVFNCRVEIAFLNKDPKESYKLVATSEEEAKERAVGRFMRDFGRVEAKEEK